ncbi:MAG: FliH/SctL family protein [Phycisphaerales bacterium]
MAVIRSAEAKTMARDAIVLDLGELARQADRILGQAQFKAERIVEDAQKERQRLIADAEKVGIERGHKAGYDDGFKRGQEAGAAEARERVADDLQILAAAWGDALEGFETVRVALFREARLDVLKLAVEIAEKVAKRAVDADEQAAARQLEAALELLARPTNLRIACSPDDRRLLADLMPNLESRFTNVRSAAVIEDPSLSRGSVVVRTDKGEIDATIETQIARVVEALLPDRAATALPTEPDAAPDPGQPDEGDGSEAP